MKEPVKVEPGAAFGVATRMDFRIFGRTPA